MRLLERYRGWKTRLGGGRVYSGHRSDRPELEVEPHHQRRGELGGGTPVWVNGRQLDRLLYLTADGEVFTRAERLATLVEANPRVEVEGLQFWLSAGANVYRRDSDTGNAELSLNLLADAVGELAARQDYEAFSAEVVSCLPARWILTRCEIHGWVSGRSG